MRIMEELSREQASRLIPEAEKIAHSLDPGDMALKIELTIRLPDEILAQPCYIAQHLKDFVLSGGEIHLVRDGHTHIIRSD
jgi:hypothetical protein